MAEYSFVTVWHVDAPVEQVWEAIYHPLRWPAWWKGVVATEELEQGDDSGVGAVHRYAVPAQVEHGFLRIVTNPRVYADPTPMATALAFCRDFRESAAFAWLPVAAGLDQTFERLLMLPGVSGNLVPDAYLAALAIEADAEFITADRGFARFPGLRWHHPLDT